MQLPHSKELPIGKLAGSFGSTSATYKFYWLLAVIELVEERNNKILKRDLFASMIANAWYTVNYFHVSFGKQDLIQKAVEDILKIENLTVDIKKEKLTQKLQDTKNKATATILSHFNKNVPHWFLSPWFPKSKIETHTAQKKRIYESSQKLENDCLYALYEDYIIINPIWTGYLQTNAKIIKDFCYWNLSLFLQSRNPNVPAIPNKLIRPILRSSLSRQRSQYWDIVFAELGTIDCIFTNTRLGKDNFVLDHFVPHAFVSHNLLWNLIPIEKHFNTIKSDRLPLLEKHFDKFFALQKTAYEIMRHNPKSQKLLEDYLTIFPELENTGDFRYDKFKESLQPLISIAGNNGFSYLIG
ncbi:hypothetical protein GGR22_001622 [Flavobacterium gossypii]|uniref:HNH nuclease domain-containing protein n=1 Tax=Flavobacterium gossypii TaxID=1646119 RepID=A0ABR6DP70_9FLAO|nr:HNH endonuclease domain-containing protein [Flavobacterium gossypii]MBA9073496.1 hypothetical protein [Flavobacterium gossypii]